MNKNIGDMTKSELIDYVIELQEENSRCERKIDKAIEYVNTHKPSDTISFPLMKKDEENQVKSCFDYEFREIYQKELLEILEGNKWNEVEIAYLDDKPIGSDKE